jgi:hypothetical protein
MTSSTHKFPLTAMKLTLNIVDSAGRPSVEADDDALASSPGTTFSQALAGSDEPSGNMLAALPVDGGGAGGLGRLRWRRVE